jgi:DtxR family Mn-dependent transcriptional regulator
VTGSSDDLHDLNEASKSYLEAIYELEEEGRQILRARLSERLGLSPATVSEGVKRLVSDGFVETEGREIELTERGRGVAETLVRRHRLAERMLTDLLGIPWHLCHHQAEDWEKVMTPEVEQAILEKISGPPTCPHGNPIPGTKGAPPWADLRAVADMAPGETGVLTRLLEDVELNGDVMLFLEQNRLVPGTEVSLESVGPDGTRGLVADGHHVAIGPDLADNIFVAAPGRHPQTAEAARPAGV